MWDLSGGASVHEQTSLSKEQKQVVPFLVHMAVLK